jgi:hypothetical protein
MTQLATPANIRAPLDGRLLDAGGHMRLEARGAEVWATLPDPDAIAERRPAKDVTRRVILTTGSHREQAFWVRGRREGDLRLVPFVWLVADSAFVARRDAFLVPPTDSEAGSAMPPVRWASSCIACHAVAGEPRHDLERDVFDTRAAELGVACEACHGPGGAHVDRHRDPITRYLQHASKEPDPTIVHPKRLPPERSAALCGQCHAYAFPRDENGWWTDGYARTFRAGDLLEPSRTLITKDMLTRRPAQMPSIDAPVESIFWPDDGGVRIGGREYNGLVMSPCYLRGSGDRKMTCLSCHTMHEGDPAGQIAPSRVGDRACTTCHTDEKARTHSHHRAGSAGAACVSCHMPKTSYALLSAVRSHRIDSPRALTRAAPNACNLCHLDRTLTWTARWLSDWYGISTTPLPEDSSNVPVGLHDGLAGDAAIRALIADALGGAEALAACGSGFQEPLLDEMRRDPYAAVRFIAERSRRRLSGQAAGPALDPDRVRSLAAVRDTRPITIAE